MLDGRWQNRAISPLQLPDEADQIQRNCPRSVVYSLEHCVLLLTKDTKGLALAYHISTDLDISSGKAKYGVLLHHCR